MQQMKSDGLIFYFLKFQYRDVMILEAVKIKAVRVLQKK